MTAVSHEAHKQLAAIFPSIPAATLWRVLERHAFNTALAAEDLLNPNRPQQHTDGPSSSGATRQAGWHQGMPPWLHSFRPAIRGPAEICCRLSS
ncbi:hypothetical protein WJX72_002030 [[Myrmecia] bisecta]|uniref:CUE domain-containing protein n=1 Tax=[Myrmecia] bisecta TaxID=41462 RepID=A0AAW1Q6L7_9CHLO